jgi:hypothetical protein
MNARQWEIFALVATILSFVAFSLAAFFVQNPWNMCVGLGIVISLAAAWCFYKEKRHRTLTSLLLPTSAHWQAGDASDIHSAPDANAPAFILDQGSDNRGVLRQPPPAVMRGTDNPSGFYLGRPVIQ